VQRFEGAGTSSGNVAFVEKIMGLDRHAEFPFIQARKRAQRTTDNLRLGRIALHNNCQFYQDGAMQ
jgi:hypothetical protein